MRISALLPFATARSLGRAVMAVQWRFAGRTRRVTECNLELAYPRMTASERQRLTRRSLAATGELAGEMGHVWLRPWSRLQDRLEVRGDEPLREALASGRGVLMIVPHLGNWEVVGLHLATFGAVVSLYQPPRLAALGGLIERARQRTGAVLVPTDRSGIRAMLRALRCGEIAGILPDQVPAKGAAGCNVPFMGVPCFTSTLPNRLLRRSGALAMMAYAERVRGGFIIHYRLAEKDLACEDSHQAATALNREVETCLQHCPAQYQWEYKRFRTRTVGPQQHDSKQDSK